MRKGAKQQLLRVVPALTARTQLGQILRRVRENRERFVVGRRGEPQAVIMNVQEYLEHFARKSLAVERLRSAAKSRSLDALPLRTIDAEIRRHRNEQKR